MDHSALVHRKKRQRHRLSSRQVYETYLILLTSLYFDNLFKVDEVMIKDMLAFARIVNHPHITFKLYQVLCSVYCRQNHFEEAERYGMMAFQYFRQQNNQLEMAITAYGLAANNFCLHNRAETEQWLDLAANYFAEENYPRQYATIASMYGQLAIMDEDYSAAKQWLEIALEECEVLKDPYRIAHGKFSLGLALAYANQFEEAESFLSDALGYYVEKGDEQGQVTTLVTIAFNQGRAGAIKEAQQILNQAHEILATLADSRWKDQQLEQIQMLEDGISDGTIKTLKPPPWE